MAHNHSHCCKHENVKFCGKCDTPYCEDCGKEWFEECTLSHNYGWYPWTNTIDVPYCTTTIYNSDSIDGRPLPATTCQHTD